MSARLESISAAPLAHAAVAAHAPTRVASIDILRGLVMVLMALDHVRDFFTSVRFDPLDLSQTSVPLFLTRWVTHFCAPTFVLLAGVSAYLMSQRCSRAELSRFLFTRGLWLVVLEVTLISLVWTFNLRYDHGLFLQVIWAIGVSMMVLALLVHLPMRAIVLFSFAVICGHNFLDSIQPAGPRRGVAAVVGAARVRADPARVRRLSADSMDRGHEPRLLHRRALRARAAAARPSIHVARHCLARSVRRAARAERLWRSVGLDAAEHDARTLLSFVNVQKYPPSLHYLLITLGVGLLLLAAFESARGKVGEVLRTFGRVPLFFYVLHIALAHLAAGIVGYAMGFGSHAAHRGFPAGAAAVGILAAGRVSRVDLSSWRRSIPRAAGSPQ